MILLEAVHRFAGRAQVVAPDVAARFVAAGLHVRTDHAWKLDQALAHSAPALARRRRWLHATGYRRRAQWEDILNVVCGKSRLVGGNHHHILLHLPCEILKDATRVLEIYRRERAVCAFLHCARN